LGSSTVRIAPLLSAVTADASALIGAPWVDGDAGDAAELSSMSDRSNGTQKQFRRLSNEAGSEGTMTPNTSLKLQIECTVRRSLAKQQHHTTRTLAYTDAPSSIDEHHCIIDLRSDVTNIPATNIRVDLHGPTNGSTDRSVNIIDSRCTKEGHSLFTDCTHADRTMAL